eukprot:30965-Pelagococcus_subviridis.AAC.6
MSGPASRGRVCCDEGVGYSIGPFGGAGFRCARSSPGFFARCSCRLRSVEPRARNAIRDGAEATRAWITLAREGNAR